MKKHKTIKRIIFVFLFIILLPLIIIEKIIKGIFAVAKKRKFRKIPYGVDEFLMNADIERIDIMEGYEFEKFLMVMYMYLGYDVKETARTGDYGADLIMTKNNELTVVQAKRYNGNVGAKAIQEIYAAKEHYKAENMVVITNSYFTKQAIIMAKELDVLLIDRDELISNINETKDIIAETGGYKQKRQEKTFVEDDTFSRFRI